MPNDGKLEQLRSALIEGEESGPSTMFDFNKFIEQKTADAQPSDAVSGSRKET
jgi:Arc/MetJ-type ribon-helix-helix transcriptional regulator